MKPDPGRVPTHRLNRVEYANSIRDLLGVDFRATDEFPPDDSGYGFDNIGDVLTVSPVLMQKYLAAAEKIAARVVVGGPLASRSRPSACRRRRPFASRRSSAIRVHYALHPASGLFTLSEPGTLSVADDGGLTFTPGPGTVRRLSVDPAKKTACLAALVALATAKPTPPQGRGGGS